MNAISTFLKTVLFLVLCVAGWTILPVLFIIGGLALFLYALAVESYLSFRDSKTRDAPAAEPPPSIAP